MNTAKSAPVPLSALSAGQCGRVCGMDEGHPFCRRLLDLGFVPGSRVRVRHSSPLRDPVEYEVRDTRICLRRTESRCILVLPENGLKTARSNGWHPNGNGNGRPSGGKGRE
ncbi:MAG TPA: FeoA family protein [Acidobacteriota bacterium]|nr:FeoA family protein [Acidobacteriota bacterium]